MKTLVRALLVEDDEDDVVIAREFLSHIETFDFAVDWVSSISKARSRVLEDDYDIFLIDYHLGGENGLDFVHFVHDQGILVPSIILTGQNNLHIDIDASRSGASDYLVKGELNASLLERSIRFALSRTKIIRELDEKERKYRSLFERSMDPIILATPTLELSDVNEAFVQLFGYTAAEIRGRSMQMIFSDNESFARYRDNLRDTAHIKDFEVRLVNRAGEERDCLLNCIYIPHPTEDLCCFQCIVHDLTLRKRAEKDLLIAERLSLTGKLARTIAHEVRNPLTNLSLALDQIRKELPQNNEAGILYADIIERNAKRIEQLVGEMLRSGKPKELNLQLSILRDILTDTLRLATDRIKLNQLRLEVDIGEDLPKILVDPEKIQVALLNIIINAVEAVQKETGILRVRAFKTEQGVTVSISDNGKGISDEDINRLFDPFFTGKQGGMGLGLTSTKNILDSHCAHVEVESEVGSGTTFYIRFTVPG